jgi:hypothetical protein
MCSAHADDRVGGLEGVEDLEHVMAAVQVGLGGVQEGDDEGEGVVGVDSGVDGLEDGDSPVPVVAWSAASSHIFVVLT